MRIRRFAGSIIIASLFAGPPAAAATGGRTSSSISPASSSPASNSAVGFGSAPPPSWVPPTGAPVVAIAASPDNGYWLADANGGVFAFDGAGFFGSAAGLSLTQPIVGMAGNPSGHGYWLVAADGGIFTYGDAGFFGSTAGMLLTQPIVGMAAAPTGHGYWLVAADGGVFCFGTAGFFGSAGGLLLNRAIVGMAPDPSGHGYWLVAADGGIFTYGDASFEGASPPLTMPIMGMAATPDGHGYWMVASDGGLFTFGNARFYGSGSGTGLPSPVVGMAADPAGTGYWLGVGTAPDLLGAIANAVASRSDNVSATVYDIHTGWTYAFRPGVTENTASTLKVDVLATVLTQHPAPLTAARVALATPMIEKSTNTATDVLWGQVGPGGVASMEDSIGMTKTVPATNGLWGTTQTTATDRVTMVKAVVLPNPVLGPATRTFILGLMEHITPTQDWGATGGVPPGVTVALKNGFAPSIGWQINTEGWVNGDGRNYIIGVISNGNPTESYGITTVDGVSTAVFHSF